MQMNCLIEGAKIMKSKKTIILVGLNIALILALIISLAFKNENVLSDKPVVVGNGFTVTNVHITSRTYKMTGTIKVGDEAKEQHTYNLPNIKNNFLEEGGIYKKDESLLVLNDENEVKMKHNGYIENVTIQANVLTFTVAYFTRHEIAFNLADEDLINNISKGDIFDVIINNRNEKIEVYFINFEIIDNLLLVKAIYENSKEEIIYESEISITKILDVDDYFMYVPNQYVIFIGENTAKVKIQAGDTFILTNITFEYYTDFGINVLTGLSDGDKLVML